VYIIENQLKSELENLEAKLEEWLGLSRIALNLSC
jgi:hypothetical protein